MKQDSVKQKKHKKKENNTGESDFSGNEQHNLTPRIYVLHKITIALKFMSYINQKLRPSDQTVLNLCLTLIENFGKKCTRKSGVTGN